MVKWSGGAGETASTTLTGEPAQVGEGRHSDTGGRLDAGHFKELPPCLYRRVCESRILDQTFVDSGARRQVCLPLPDVAGRGLGCSGELVADAGDDQVRHAGLGDRHLAQASSPLVRAAPYASGLCRGLGRRRRRPGWWWGGRSGAAPGRLRRAGQPLARFSRWPWRRRRGPSG